MVDESELSRNINVEVSEAERSALGAILGSIKLGISIDQGNRLPRPFFIGDFKEFKELARGAKFIIDTHLGYIDENTVFSSNRDTWDRLDYEGVNGLPHVSFEVDDSERRVILSPNNIALTSFTNKVLTGIEKVVIHETGMMVGYDEKYNEKALTKDEICELDDVFKKVFTMLEHIETKLEGKN